MTDSGDRASHRVIAADLLSEGLDDLALEISAAGFAALWQHKARHPQDLVHADPVSLAQVIAELVARGRCQLANDGRLIGIHGLTLQSTRHGFLHGAHVHHTWCAFDAVGIPAALGIDAIATTDCPTCGRPLRIELTAGAPADTNGFALWLPATTGDHLINSFCANADIYCSLEHLHERIDTAITPGEIADLIQATTLGRGTWAAIANPTSA